MQTVAENIEITAEGRVMRALGANIEAEYALDGAVGVDRAAEMRQRDSLFEQRQALEVELMGMEPRTTAGALMKALIGVVRVDDYLGNARYADAEAPAGIGDLLCPIIREAAARITGEGARDLELALSWYVDPA